MLFFIFLLFFLFNDVLEEESDKANKNINSDEISEVSDISEFSDENENIDAQLKKHVVNDIGPIAKPDEINFTDSLPKTRSGKIMR